MTNDYSDPIIAQQQRVAERQHFLMDRTRQDREALKVLDELTPVEQVEFACDLADYLGAHFAGNDTLDADSRLENLYSSLILHPGLEITPEHIDVFATAAMHATASLENQEFAQTFQGRILEGRRTALNIKNRYFPLGEEIEPVVLKNDAVASKIGGLTVDLANQ